MGYKLKKIVLRIVIILVAVIALGLIIRAVFNYSSGKRLESYVEQMKAEGIPLSLKEAEPECAPQNNAALDWKKAEVFLSIEREQRKMLGKTIDGLFYDKPIEKNAREQIQDLRNKNQEALNLILEASSKSCFKYWETWDVFLSDSDMPKVSQLIQGFRLIGIDAVLKAEEGQIEEAIDQCLKARRFLKLYLQEPFLINYLIDMALIKINAVCFNTIVSNQNLETEILEKILLEWEASPWKEGLVRALELEKTSMIEAILFYLSGELDLDPDQVIAGDFYYWLFRPVLKNEIIYMIETWDELIEVVKMPYFASRNGQKIEKIIKEIPWYYKLARMRIPNFWSALLKKATLDALVETARIGIACKIFKNLYGDFPEILDELSPGILAEIPLDPFTGKPYIYKKDDTGFIVYSVGSNLKDEGGRGTWAITQLVMEKDDDWAWKTKTQK